MPLAFSSQSSAFSSPNPFASSSRPPRNLEEPLVFNKDYKYLTNWYNFHRSSGSTTIQKMQLRKEHVTPFHEFIMVRTQAGYMYRVDRGREVGGTVLDTLKKQGVPPVDTIALLRHLTSLEDLDGTSYCRIELSWGSDKAIDLKLVLDVCFQIHSKSGTRYKLLTHNCYFFSQTIIMIAARKTVACKLKDMSHHFSKRLWDIITRIAAETILEWWRTHLKQEVLSQLQLQPLQNMWKTGWWQDLLNRELELRSWELGQELKLRRKNLMGELEGVLAGVLEQELEWKLVRELLREMLHPREPEREWEQVQQQWKQRQQGQEQQRQRQRRVREQWVQSQWPQEQERQWQQIVKDLLKTEKVKWWEWKWIQMVLALVPMLVSKRKRLELKRDQVRRREWEAEWRREWMQEREREQEQERECEQEQWQQRVQSQEQVQLWVWRELWQVWEQALEQVCEWEHKRRGLRQDLGSKLDGHFEALEQQGVLEELLGTQLGPQLGMPPGPQLGMQLGQLGMQLGMPLRKQLGKHLAEVLEPQIVFRLQLPADQHHQPQTYQQLQAHLQDQCKLVCQAELVLFQKVLVEVLDRGLTWELEPSWDRNCSKIMEATNMPDESATWARQLIETLGEIVIREAQMEQLLSCSFPHLLEFPALFSVSSKANAKAPNVVIERFEDLEICIKELVEQHLDSVPLAMRLREKLKAKIINGMTATWHLVRPQF